MNKKILAITHLEKQANVFRTLLPSKYKDKSGRRHRPTSVLAYTGAKPPTRKYKKIRGVIMRSFTTLDLQYAHRFYGFKGEAQYLHGHTGILTIEVEDDVNMGVNMVFPCNEIKKIAWEVLHNFDHALILREDDPLLPAILGVYEAQGIKDGAPTNKQKGPAFKTELATAYPECRLVVTKETMTVEGMIKIVYDLLKDKLNIVKLTFTSGVNGATEEYEPKKGIDRCPLCGIALNENGQCPKCGYKK